MHLSTVSALFFASLATAQHHHFHHRRQYNTTASALGEQTTLTVYATTIHTVTSCAATVTDCPANPHLATSEMVVTDTIALTTTVCPVAEASSASSAILAAATSSALGAVSVPPSYPTVPLSTGASSPVVTSAPGSPESSVVLTYTLGAGTSTTIVTTTIRHYSTVTEYAVKATTSAAGVEGASASESGEEPTTTYTQTSTSTRYVTVSAVPSEGAGAGPTGVIGAVSAPGECVPVTVTVAATTVTVAAQTVTITESVPLVAASSALGAVSVPADTYPTSSLSVAGETASSSGPVIIMSTATVVPLPVATSTPAPYGYSNGTDTATNAPYPSSGFLSVVRASSTSSAEGVVSSTSSIAPVATGYPEYPTY